MIDACGGRGTLPVEEEKDDPETWGDIWRTTVGYWIGVPLTMGGGETYWVTD